MTIPQDEFDKALGLPSNSPLTQEEAAKRLKDAFDAQERALSELRNLFEQQLKSDHRGRWRDTYTVYIQGSFRAHCKTAAEAIEYVEKNARPFNASWEIKDPFQQTYAKG